MLVTAKRYQPGVLNMNEMAYLLHYPFFVFGGEAKISYSEHILSFNVQIFVYKNSVAVFWGVFF